MVPEYLYDTGRGKPHGKWPLCNGAIQDKETLAEARTNCCSPKSKRSRQEQEEHIEKLEGENQRISAENQRILVENQIIKAHSHDMTQWGKSVSDAFSSLHNIVSVCS